MLEYEKQQEIKSNREEAKKIALERAKLAVIDAEIEEVIPGQVGIDYADPVGSQTVYHEPQQVKEPEPELEVLTFKVAVTPEQKKALRAFFVENKIKVGRV